MYKLSASAICYSRNQFE